MNCIIDWEVYHQVMKTPINFSIELKNPMDILKTTDTKVTVHSNTDSEGSSRTDKNDSGDTDPDGGKTIR